MNLADYDRLIGRIPEDDRQKLLDEIVRATQHGSTVEVSWSWTRNLENVQSVICRILGLAVAHGGASTFVLVVDPVDPDKRMVTISSARLVRIRWAGGNGSANPADYDLGLVIAGPPM